MYTIKLQIAILFYGISLVNGFFHFHRDHFLLRHEQTNSFHKTSLRSDPTHWIEQQVDHFNGHGSTWMQKYYKVMTSWKPKGPIIFILGGERTLTLYELDNGYLNGDGGELQPLIGQIAEETGAATFMLEHRYYGESQPFDKWNTENLKFLTSRQALADAAHLLKTIKRDRKFRNSKVIVTGRSYAGNLAVWMKLLYPELIDAVLASSAPVLAKKDFSEYLETVTDTFKTYGSQECVSKITERFNTLQQLLKRPKAIGKLKAENNICEDVDMTIPEHQQLFFLDLGFHYMVTAQYGTRMNVFSTCQHLNSFDLYRENRIFWDSRRHCSVYNFNYLKNSISRFPDPDFYTWLYQTCTEFGYFQSTTSSKQMFGNTIPVDLYYKTCRKVFGKEFNEQRVDRGVMNTNKMYGGLTPNVTNVVFVNGDMDPWHRLGIVHDLSDDAPAIFIKGSSHCHDYTPSLDDTDDIKEARRRIKNILKKWIG